MKALKCSHPLILNLAILGNNQSCTQRSLHKAIYQVIYNAKKLPNCLTRIKYGMCIKCNILHVLKIKFSYGDSKNMSGCQGLGGGRDE